MKHTAAFRFLRVAWTGMGLLTLGSGVAQSRGPSGLYVQQIQLVRASDHCTLRFRFSQPPESIYAFALASPARLVIDVRGAVERSASSTYPASDALIARVRAGSHPHYTRFVVDLKGGRLPPFSVEQRAHVVTSTITALDSGTDNAGAPSPGDTQVLYVRAPEVGSQHPSPRPAGVPVPPAPTVLAKKVTKKRSPAALRHVTPSAPQVGPGREGPAPASPLLLSPEEPRAAIPLKEPLPAVPAPSASIPEVPSQDTPRPLSPAASQHLRQGYTLYNQGNVDGALRQWRQVIHQAPDHAEAHYRTGVALQERGELAQAITAFREAARLNPADATIHIRLARTYEAEGNTQAALAAYRQALPLVPTSAHVHHRIGHVLAAEGKLAEAMQAWRQTIHLQPDYAYAYVSLGRALGQTGQTGEAVAAYEQALRLDPRAPFVDEVRQQIAQLRAAEP